MRKVALVLIMLLSAGTVLAGDSVYNRNRFMDANGWSIYAVDEDIDTTPAMVQDPASFTQLAAEDEVEVLSTYGNNPVITIDGINDEGKKFSESITLTGNIAATSSTTARYITGATLATEATDTVVIRRESDNAFIASISAGTLESTLGQHFNGEKTSYITGWGVSNGTATDITVAATNSVLATLRIYKDDADSLDASDGYQVVDSIFTSQYESSKYKKFANPVKMSAGGWLSVYAEGKENNQKANVRIEGYDQ